MVFAVRRIYFLVTRNSFKPAIESPYSESLKPRIHPCGWLALTATCIILFAANEISVTEARQRYERDYEDRNVETNNKERTIGTSIKINHFITRKFRTTKPHVMITYGDSNDNLYIVPCMLLHRSSVQIEKNTW